MAFDYNNLVLLMKYVDFPDPDFKNICKLGIFVFTLHLLELKRIHIEDHRYIQNKKKDILF